MAQRKKKLTKKKRRLPSHGQNREPEVDSDEGDFELAAEIKNDDSVRFFSDRTSSDVCITWIATLKLVVISGVRKIEFTPWNCFTVITYRLLCRHYLLKNVFFKKCSSALHIYSECLFSVSPVESCHGSQHQQMLCRMWNQTPGSLSVLRTRNRRNREGSSPWVRTIADALVHLPTLTTVIEM